MTSKLDNLLTRYYDRFGEAFPVRMAPMNPEELYRTIEGCLKTGRVFDPYAQPGFDPNAEY